jgi:hypothetical protein
MNCWPTIPVAPSTPTSILPAITLHRIAGHDGLARHSAKRDGGCSYLTSVILTLMENVCPFSKSSVAF